MPFAVLKHFHPMVGYDLHIVMPPGSPVPGPPGPHVAMSTLMGIGATAKMGPTETTHFGWTILRGSDIGPLIPHAPLVPNCLLPIILLASASKSHFGSSQYLVQNQPAAAALLVVVNPNLNCADPCAMPLDGVVALTAHFVDMTLGDIISGFLHMAVDIALSAAMNYLGNRIFGRLSQRLYESVLFGPMMSMFERMGYGRVSMWLLQHDFQEMMAKGLFARLGTLIGADFLGNPLGYSFPINLFGAADSGAGHLAGGDDRGAMENAHDAVQRYIDSPSVESHDVAPGPDAGTGGASADSPDAGTSPSMDGGSDAGTSPSGDGGSDAGTSPGGDGGSTSASPGASDAGTSPGGDGGSTSAAPSSTGGDGATSSQPPSDQGGVCQAPDSTGSGSSSASPATSTSASSSPTSGDGGTSSPAGPGTTGSGGSDP